MVGGSPGTPASSITKTGRHDIAEILLKVTLNTINQINHFKVLQKLQWEKLKKKAVYTNTFFGFNF